MPRQGLRHTHPNSPARRRLFGAADSTLSARLEAEVNENLTEQSQRWGFDFRNDRPLDAASSSSGVEYTALNAEEVPLAYRPHTLKREELPDGRVLEVKIYPAGRGPMPTHSPNVSTASESAPSPKATSSAPNSSLDESTDDGHDELELEAHLQPEEDNEVMQVAVLTPTRGTKRRHQPEPAQTPMKLRRRPSPHKTPVSKTPVHTPAKSPRKSRTSTRQLFPSKPR